MSVHYIRPNKTLVRVTNKSEFTDTAIPLTHIRQVTSIETLSQYQKLAFKIKKKWQPYNTVITALALSATNASLTAIYNHINCPTSGKWSYYTPVQP